MLQVLVVEVKVLISLEIKLLDFLTPESNDFDDIAQGGFQGGLTQERSNQLTKLILFVLLITMNFIFR